MNRLFDTNSSNSVLFAHRVLLALVMLPNGLQKTLGWFGGPGFQGWFGSMTGAGLPGLLVFLVILAESLGAIALLLGFLTRVAAFGLAAVMVGAVLTVHLSHGFFMNWMGSQAGEGFEYHLLAIGLLVPLVLFGGGASRSTRCLPVPWEACRAAPHSGRAERTLRRGGAKRLGVGARPHGG